MQTKNENTGSLLQQLATLKEDSVVTEDFRKKLSVSINELINGDFEKLVQILYRLDIDESKLKTTLRENRGHDAGALISELIIERQLQKIKSRREFGEGNEAIDEDEKW